MAATVPGTELSKVPCPDQPCPRRTWALRTARSFLGTGLAVGLEDAQRQRQRIPPYARLLHEVHISTFVPCPSPPGVRSPKYGVGQVYTTVLPGVLWNCSTSVLLAELPGGGTQIGRQSLIWSYPRMSACWHAYASLSFEAKYEVEAG